MSESIFRKINIRLLRNISTKLCYERYQSGRVHKNKAKNTGKRLYSSQNLAFSTVLYSRMLKYTYNVHSKNVNSETKTSFKTVKHKQENKAKIKEQDNYSVRCLRYPKCSCLANRAYLVLEKSSCAKKIFLPKNPSDSVCQETFTGGRLFKSRLA